MTDTLRTLPSVCPLDCPDTCSLKVAVKEGEVVSVRGSDANPFTAGVICNKVMRSYPEFVHGAGRLRHPLKRTGPRGTGAYERISWADALDLIHSGFTKAVNEHGPEAVMPLNYAGPHGELAGGSMDRRFFYKLGATMLDRGPLCGAVRGTAYSSLFGAAPGMPPEQAEHADLIFVWGNNVTVSNLHLMRILNRARAKGAKVVIIDPKRIKVAEQCDLFVQIRPGTDVVLALAVAAELERQNAFDREFIANWVLGFEDYMQEARQWSSADVAEICEVPEEQFNALVTLIAGAGNFASSFGNGIERGRSGGAGLRAAMALHALTGHHGRIGAGVIAKSGLAVPKTTSKLHGDHLKQPGTRCFNIVDVPAKLLDPGQGTPVNAIMIYNHNPVATHPDQSAMLKALLRDDLFIAGADVVMTDSMAMCDVILPAASHFEFADIYGAYGQNYVQRAAPVIPCVGESLPNTEIFRRLAVRFGFDGPEFEADDAELINDAMDGADPRLSVHGGPGGVPLDKAVEMPSPDSAPLIMCKTVKPATGSGCIELFSQDLEDRFGCGVPRYQPAPHPPGENGEIRFTLISPSSAKRTNATFGGCEQSQGPEVVEMHPDDAGALKLSDNDMVTVRNERGAVSLRLIVSGAVLPGVLYSPKGTWRGTSQTGLTVNVLIPSGLRTDIENGACYNETFVTVERALPV